MDAETFCIFKEVLFSLIEIRDTVLDAKEAEDEEGVKECLDSIWNLAGDAIMRLRPLVRGETK